MDLASLLLAGAFLGVVVLAWQAGGQPERAGAAVLMSMVVLSALRFALGIHKTSIDLAGLAIDTLVFAGFAWIALFAWRIWPLWAASLQLISVASHLVHPLGIPLVWGAYHLMRTAPTHLEVLVLMMGTAACMRRKRAGIKWPSWRVWSEQSSRLAPSRLLKKF